MPMDAGASPKAVVRLGGSWIDRSQTLTTRLSFAAPIDQPIYLTFVLFMAASAVRTNSSVSIAAAFPASNQRST